MRILVFAWILVLGACSQTMTKATSAAVADVAADVAASDLTDQDKAATDETEPKDATLASTDGPVASDGIAEVIDALADVADGIASDVAADAAVDAVADSADAVDAVATPADTAGPPEDATSCSPAFAEHYGRIISKVMADGPDGLIVAGNVNPPANGQLGPLWLARIGAKGVVKTEHTYDGANGPVIDVAHSATGEFAILRGVSPSGQGVNIVATQADGTALWSKDFVPITTNAKANSLTARSDGNFIIAGVKAKAGKGQGWLLGFDITGALVLDVVQPSVLAWTRAVTSSTGTFAVFGVLDGGAGTVGAAVAADGSVLWQTAIAVDGELTAAAPTNDGGYFLATIGQDSKAIAQPETFAQVVMVSRLDAAGKVLWTTPHGWSAPAEWQVVGIGATTDGGYILAGSFFDIAVQLLEYKGKPLPPGTISNYWYALRGAADGKAVWAKTYAPGGGKGGQTLGMAALCGNGLAMVGIADVGGKPSYDGWVVRTDSAGNVPLGPGASVISISPP